MATQRTVTSIGALLATGVFAAAVLVGPRLLVSGVDAGGSAEVFAADAEGASLELTTSASVGVALGDNGDVAVNPPVPVPPAIRPESLPAAVRLDGLTDEGALTVTVAPVEAGPYHHDDEIRFRIAIVNSGTEYLWGVYAYLEGYGEVECSDRRLAPGEASECVARVRLDAEDFLADAWATAWTESEEIRSGDRFTARIEA